MDHQVVARYEPDSTASANRRNPASRQCLATAAITAATARDDRQDDAAGHDRAGERGVCQAGER
jgi:hypothetical protein